MTKAVHVAVYDTLADWEVGFATAHINNPMWQREPDRYQVVTVGPTKDPVTSIGGLHITPDAALADLEPHDSAMLILPGADGWLTGENTAFVEKAKAFLDAGVPVAAICGATVGLASAGLLDTRAHTSNAPVVLTEVGYGGAALYRDEPAVTDQNVITASATAPVTFAREVLALLDVYEPHVLAAWYRLYGDGDPDGYFELMEAAA